MVLYVLLIAVANLALGFGLAVYLGRQCRPAIGTDESWSTGAALGQSFDSLLAGEADLAAGAAILGMMEPEQPSAGATSGAMAEEASDDSAAPQPDQSPHEKAADDLSGEVQQPGQQVARADERLRACADDPDAVQIEAILGSLKDSTRQYLDQRDQVHRALDRQVADRPDSREAEMGLPPHEILHEGKCPTPVVPPTISLEESHVTL